MLLCQFLVLAGNWQFFCCGGKVLLQPEKKDIVVCLAGCAVMSVFGSGGKLAVFLLWRERFITTGKKKDTVVCLAGARSLLRPEKKDTVVCLAGARSCLSFLSGLLYLY